MKFNDKDTTDHKAVHNQIHYAVADAAAIFSLDTNGTSAQPEDQIRPTLPSNKQGAPYLQGKHETTAYYATMFIIN